MIMQTSTKKFFRDAFLYMAATMMTPALGVILIPVFTNQLTPAEYGIMTTVHALVGFLQLFMVLSLHGAITRLYYDFSNKEQQKAYLGSILLFVTGFAVILSLSLLMSQKWIAPLLFKSIPHEPYYAYLIVLSFLMAWQSIPATILRIKERARTYFVIYSVKSVLVLLLTLVFLYWGGLGAASYLLAMGIAGAVTLILFLWSIRRDVSFSFSKPFISMSLAFSLPLLPHVLSNWIITTSDRVLLEKFISLDTIGVYALAVQMAMVVRMVFMSVNSAFVPKYNQLSSSSNHREASRLLRVFLYLILAGGLVGWGGGYLFLELVGASGYQEATRFVGVLIGAEVIFGLNYLLIAKLSFMKKTGKLSISSSAAAVINVLINLSLIPVIGVWGAVVSTYLAEIARTMLNVIWTKRLHHRRGFD